MRLIITLLVLFSSCNLLSQQKESLNKIKKLQKRIVKRLKSNDIEGLELSIDSLRELGEKKDPIYGEFLSRTLLVDLYLLKKDFNSAEKLLLESREQLKLRKSSQLRDTISLDNFIQLAHFYYDKEAYAKSTESYYNALKISGKLKDSAASGYIHNGLGSIYLEVGDYEAALQQFKQSITYSIDRNKKYEAYSNIGATYYSMENYNKAEEFVLKSLEFLKKQDREMRINAYNTLAAIYAVSNELDKAEQYFLKVYEITKEVGSKEDIETNILNLSVFYLQLGKEKEAKEFIKKCDSIASVTKSISYKVDAYYNIYVYNEELKNYKKALSYFEKYVKYKDSLYSKDSEEYVNKLKVQHETELKNEKISNQNLLIETQKSKNKWLVSGIVFLVLLMGFLIYIHRQRIIAQRELASEKIKTLLETEKTKSIQSKIDVQNKERERIAKDLHDNISGNLATIKLKMSQLQKQSIEIQDIITSLDDTYNEVRTISHDLIPEKSVKNTFVELIKKLIIFRGTKDLKIALEMFPEDELNTISQKIQSELYSILQELLTNVQKHSKASKCTVNITLHNDEYINLLVEDNGVGLSKNTINKGIGLKNIRSRVVDLKGNLHIESQKGTIVNVDIPI